MTADPATTSPVASAAGAAAAVLGRLRGPAVAAGACTGLAFLVGALPWLSGDDPARTVLRARSAERGADPATLEAVRTELDLPSGPVSGTLTWLAGAVRGDLGASWVTGAPVGPTVAAALGVSLTLALFASLVALGTGLLVSAPTLLRAVRTGRPGGRTADVTGALLASLPDFLLASVLLAVVAVQWGAAPTSGWRTPAHAVLPALALGLPAGGLLSRVLTGALTAAFAESWVRTWRGTGCAARTLALALLRRALAVALPQVMLVLAGLLGASVVVEAVFAVPGIGRTALDAVLAQDLPLVQGCVAALVLVGVAAGGVGIVAHRALMGPAIGGTGLTPAVPATERAHRLPAVLGGALLVVVAAGLLRDPGSIALGERLVPPSVEHPLGTDALGRDLLARVGHGALLSVGAGAAVSLAALVVGLVAGVAGTRARAGAADVLNALPPVLVGIVMAAVVGPGVVGAAVAVALVAWVPLAVHARTLAAEARASGYHQAAVVAGAGPGWILRRHVLPSVLPAVARHALLRVPHTTLALAGLGFLGLGAPHDSAEWGAMLAGSVSYVERAPWTVAAPAAALALLGGAAATLRPGRG